MLASLAERRSNVRKLLSLSIAKLTFFASRTPGRRLL